MASISTTQVNEYVITTRRICTSGGTWIPQGSILFVKDYIDSGFSTRYPNPGFYCNLIYLDTGYIIFFDDAIETERWITIKPSRLLKLIEDIPMRLV